MPAFPEDRFVEGSCRDSKEQMLVYVPPYGSGATLYIRPYMFGIRSGYRCKACRRISVQNVSTTPVGPYFKGGAKPITI